MRLAIKLITVFVVAVLLITIALSYLTVRRAYDDAEKRQKAYAERFVAELHRDLADQWEKGGVEALEKYIQSRSRDPYVESRWVWFEDAEDTSQKDYTPRAGNKAQKILNSDDQLLHIVTNSKDGNRQLNTYCLLDIENARKGGVEFTSSLARVDQQATEAVFQTVLMIGLIALLSIGMVLLASVRIVARPLEILTRKTQLIGDGDFGKPIEVSGNDELSQLADSINQMCVRLSQQQQKIAEETHQRQQTESQLRHADRLKTVGRLAAGIAHEIGTPLGVISGRAALIADGKMSADKNLESAKTIKHEADRITGTIRQLLDFARPSPLNRNTVNLVELVNETIRLITTLADKKEIELELRSPTDSIPIAGDYQQIEQVVTNLLVNAIQASDAGSSIIVELNTKETTHRHPEGMLAELGTFATLIVDDEGPGIDKENLKHIFEPFFTTKDVGQGTGLGLSIAYGIVEEHGGWIDVESEPGKGTRFVVFIPVATDS